MSHPSSRNGRGAWEDTDGGRSRSQGRPSHHGGGGGGGGSGGGGDGGGSRWANAASAAERSRHAPPGSRSYQDDEEDWDNSEWLQNKTKETQGESLSSTRRALQRLNETHATAQNNMGMMNQQSEQLHKIECRIDVAENQAKVNDAKVDHLKAVNRFFMLPSFGKGKAKRREAKLKKQEEEGKPTSKHAHLQGPAGHTTASGAAQNGSRYDRIYTTPQGVDRDDVEEELDSNLNDISSGLSRLKMMGQAMNSELDSQTKQLNRIHDRTDSSRDYMGRLNNKMDHFAPKGKK
ncbi:hypothetical protein BASA60_006649 [Batrachochytrium salamandrivorans]|nr:hypothetical protein BASA60_006649 [Batrachochytrium salamandrivorans]